MKVKSISPDIYDRRLTSSVKGRNEVGKLVGLDAVVERSLTLFLNDQEVITMMTIGDYPEYLAVGYLLNQNMLLPKDKITSVDYEEDLGVVVVRTKRKTNYEAKLKKKTLTSGCSTGTIFGDIMEKFDRIRLPNTPVFKISWLYNLIKEINTTPSLYLKAGAIHGCVLCKKERPLVYMEDVGRHNAVDKIAGYMFLNRIQAKDKVFYTTGRLTSEMIIKIVQMKIPILISRSGYTAWGIELAVKANVTLIGRARGKRFFVLSGEKRIRYDLKNSGLKKTPKAKKN
ncbi:MAG: formate dehydrogenase family accessory protein FdhD [Rickettsiales bacterium]|nr:formate dehydrogenase family accessory protein FdhD [Rickettsiales bacterium]